MRGALAPFLLASLLFLGGCAGTLFEGDRSERLHWFPRYHTVEEGETLYSIAWRYGYDYPVVAEWNDIAPPYTIKQGQRLRVAPPSDFDPRGARAGRSRAGEGAFNARRQSDTESAGREEPASNVSSRPDRPSRASARPAPNERAVASAPTDIDWAWPTDGEVVRSFPPDASGKRGIAIAGGTGDPVRAAADGRVVYAGSGLIGYGQLIILKHDPVYLSAYAHNSRLLVDEGDRVEQGELIAEMGDSGTDRVQLHFEVRRDGRPVDPEAHLPGR
ncbi:MAG: peptidoglycan DD-metalloendopeptidase family protein [Pseudomonadota bacterium]